MDGAMKTDADKEARPELVAPEFIMATATALADNVKPGSKYQEGNWSKGMKWSRAYGAMQRHLQAWWGGEDKDISGRSHLWHAACNLMFLITYEKRGIGTDDRKTLGASKE
jgi:hypothetical protein